MSLGRAARRALWNRCPVLVPRERRALLGFYRQFVAPGDLCFDVGAHGGGMTEVFLTLGARVVAVEPQQAHVTLLESAFAGEPVTVVPRALGPSNGAAKLRIGDADAMSSLDSAFIEHFERLSTRRWPGTERVDMTTLDALIEQFGAPAYTRLDIEGFEAEALRGLSCPVPYLSFEFLLGLADHTARCVAALERLAPVAFNFSTSEVRGFDAPDWTSGAVLLERLESAAKGGHVYARFAETV